jgi:U3 small nucleolar RNA-associated protein 19
MMFVKYRSRFLYWTDIFLSSTNLPAYMVASFVKKLSRLALIAPVDALLPLIPLIGNLLVRHPNLHHMIHKKSATQLTDDPFDFDQQDPKLSEALESSLWEVKSLQSHWHAQVREAAKFINKPLPQDEWDLSDLLENSFADLLEQSLSVELPDSEKEITPSIRTSVLSLF